MHLLTRVYGSSCYKELNLSMGEAVSEAVITYGIPQCCYDNQWSMPFAPLPPPLPLSLSPPFLFPSLLLHSPFKKGTSKWLQSLN